MEAAIRGGQQELRKLAMEIVGDNDMGPFDNGSGHHLISSRLIERNQLMDATLGFGRKLMIIRADVLNIKVFYQDVQACISLQSFEGA